MSEETTTLPRDTFTVNDEATANSLAAYLRKLFGPITVTAVGDVWEVSSDAGRPIRPTCQMFLAGDAREI